MSLTDTTTDTPMVAQMIAEIRRIAGDRWQARVDQSDCTVLTLRDALDPVWPATITIVVGQPGDRFGPGGDSLEGAVQLSRSDQRVGYVAHTSTVIDGCAPGAPLTHALWIDLDPPMHIVGTAFGSDLFVLADVLDEVSDRLGAIADQVDEVDKLASEFAAPTGEPSSGVAAVQPEGNDR